MSFFEYSMSPLKSLVKTGSVWLSWERACLAGRPWLHPSTKKLTVMMQIHNLRAWEVKAKASETQGHSSLWENQRDDSVNWDTQNPQESMGIYSSKVPLGSREKSFQPATLAHIVTNKASFLKQVESKVWYPRLSSDLYTCTMSCMHLHQYKKHTCTHTKDTDTHTGTYGD